MHVYIAIFDIQYIFIYIYINIYIYNINTYAYSLDSFANTANWLNEVRKFTDDNVVVFLVGNKSDLNEERQVLREAAKHFSAEEHIGFIETSALNSSNVAIAFESIVKEIYYRMSK